MSMPVILSVVGISIFLVTYSFLSRSNIATNTSKSDASKKESWKGKAKEKNSEKTISYFDAGNEMYRKGKLHSAVTKYKLSIEMNEPRKADAYNNLASVYVDQKQFTMAESAYRKSIELNDKHPSALFNFGMFLTDQKRHSEAVEMYMKLLKLTPHDGDVWANMGSCLHATNDFEAAIKAYNSALIFKMAKGAQEDRDKKQFSTLHEHIARASRKLASMETDPEKRKKLEAEAVENFELSIQFDPENHMSRHLLASLLADPDRIGHPSEDSQSGDVTADLHTAAPEFVTALFNDYSSTFEQSLEGLQYRVPQLISQHISDLFHMKPDTQEEKPAPDMTVEQLDAIETAVMNEMSDPSLEEDHEGVWSCVVDLGCGTGLLGPLLGNSSDTLIGVDLAPKMLLEAEKKQVYHHLFSGDLVSFLPALSRWRSGREAEEVGRQPIRRKFSGSVVRDVDQVVEEGLGGAFRAWHPLKPILVTAADVFVYIGDLKRIFVEVSSLCRPGDVLAFTVETDPSTTNQETESETVSGKRRKDFWLQKTGRFAHSREYIIDLASGIYRENMCIEKAHNSDTGNNSNSDSDSDDRSCRDDAESIDRREWEVVVIKDIIPRMEEDSPIAGLLVILKKI